MMQSESIVYGSNFKIADDGCVVFFPYGSRSCGYVVSSLEFSNVRTGLRAYRFLSSYLPIVLCAFRYFWLAGVSFLASLAAYRIYMWLWTKSRVPATSRLTMEEIARSARRRLTMPKLLLSAGVFLSYLVVILGGILLKRMSLPRVLFAGLAVCILVFFLFVLAWSWRKRRLESSESM